MPTQTKTRSKPEPNTPPVVLPAAPDTPPRVPPEKTEWMKVTDWEAIRITVEDYRRYASQMITCPELRAIVDRNCKRMLEIADRFESTVHPPAKPDEPSKPKTETPD